MLTTTVPVSPCRRAQGGPAQETPFLPLVLPPTTHTHTVYTNTSKTSNFVSKEESLHPRRASTCSLVSSVATTARTSTSQQIRKHQINHTISPIPLSPALKHGVFYECFHGTFDSLPDFNSLIAAGIMPSRSGILPQVLLEDGFLELGISSGNSELNVSDFALRLSAVIHIPHAGAWTFYLGSNDGSSLYVGGKRVIMHDGIHYYSEKEGHLNFPSEGLYPITVLFFHKSGKLLEGLGSSLGSSFLKLSYYCAGSGWSPFPADYLGKSVVPPTSLYYNALDVWVVRCLQIGEDPDSEERMDYLHESPAEERIIDLQQELRDTREKCIALQAYLDDAMRVIQSSNAITASVRPMSMDARMLTSNVTKMVEYIRRLERDHFFALGISFKMNSRSNVNLQEVFEYCASNNIPSEEWLNVLAKAAFPTSVETDL